MAVLGLRVNQGPTLNLSGIFKSAVQDPDAVAKMELAKSKIWNDYYQNQLYQAQTAGEAQKTADLQKVAATREGAVPGLERGYVGAIPLPPDQPVPVELSRIAGPVNGVPISAPPAIVDQNFYNDQVAGAKARARLDAYLAKDATDVESAYGKSIGQETLTSGLTPGGPARVTPDQLRLGSTLYTGNAPTTTTMMTSGDTAPGVFAAQDAAGKAFAEGQKPVIVDIAGRGKAGTTAADAAAGKPLNIIPGSQPGLTEENAPGVLAELEAAARVRQLTVGEQELLKDAQRLMDKKTAITLGKDQTVNQIDPVTHQLVPSGGQAAAAPGSIYAKGTGDDQIEKQHLDEVSAKIAMDPNYKPTALELQDYETAYANQYLKARLTSGVDASQRPISQKTYGYKPANVLTPAQVRARFEGKPIPVLASRPAAAPTQAVRPPAVLAEGSDPSGLIFKGNAGFAPPTGPASVDDPNSPDFVPQGQTVSDVVGGSKPPPLTADQARAAEIIPFMAEAHAQMRDTPVADLPDSFFAALANPENPGVIAQVIEQQVPPEARAYAQLAAQFSLYLYQLSGAAFPGGEYPRNLRTFIPVAADNPTERHNKLQAQAHAVNRLLNNAFHDDPDYRHQAQRDALARYGLRLDDSLFAPEVEDPVNAPRSGGAPASGGPPAAGAPPAGGGTSAPRAKNGALLVPQSLWDAMAATPGQQDKVITNFKLQGLL